MRAERNEQKESSTEERARGKMRRERDREMKRLA
jgi:hypothetical protein